MTNVSAARPRRRRWLAVVVVLLAAVVLIPYLAIDDERVALDDATRAASAGSFVRLSAGHTHYEVSGPDNAQTVVLVHGTTVPSFVFDRNFRQLVDAGFHVVRYDLYGRGLSDRPDARYGLDLYVTQLRELLDHVAPGRTVDLVGLSLGGMIVSEFTRQHPDRVRKLVLVGPAGIAETPLIARLVTAPGIGEYVMRVAGRSQLLPSRRMLLHPEQHASLDAAYLPTIRFRGSRRAVLATLRAVPYNAYHDAYRALGNLGKPTLLIWGREDAVVPFANNERLRELVRPAKFVAVADAGHLVNYERPDAVNSAAVEFLSR